MSESDEIREHREASSLVSISRKNLRWILVENERLSAKVDELQERGTKFQLERQAIRYGVRRAIWQLERLAVGEGTVEEIIETLKTSLEKEAL